MKLGLIQALSNRMYQKKNILKKYLYELRFINIKTSILDLNIKLIILEVKKYENYLNKVTKSVFKLI